MASSLGSIEEGDRIGVMVDALTPFLVKHVKCLHLLNYLPFMREQAARILKLDRSGDHTGASQLFLECLKQSEEPGRYASFRDALVEAKYDHIARVLEGGDIEENHTEHCKLFEVFAQPIIEKMDPIVMLQQLRQHELITLSEEDEIRNVHREHSRYDAAMTLLDCVHRRKLGWYDDFMTTMLEVYPQLVELVDPYFKEKKDRQKAAQEEEGDSIKENDLSSERVDVHDTFDRAVYKPDDVMDQRRVSETLEGDHVPVLSGKQRDDIPKCDIKNCVHCAILTETVSQLQTQIWELKSEIDTLRRVFKEQTLSNA